jgi:CheY-like chemotaxis protein
MLVVDDEDDVHTVTKMSLRSLRYQGRGVEIHHARSAAEALEVMRDVGDIALILLDVVMETDHAGLEVCRAIRKELENPFVRILLRTGQPGLTPERQVVDDYDIDGYLSKGELTATRLYTAARTALKAYVELRELERHRRDLQAIHDRIVNLVPYEPLEYSLERVLETVWEISPCSLALLDLTTFDAQGNKRGYLLHHASPAVLPAVAERERAALLRQLGNVAPERVTSVEGGFVVPFAVDHELGYGWFYLRGDDPDEITRRTLMVLAAHTANVVYGALTYSLISDRAERLSDSIHP